MDKLKFLLKVDDFKKRKQIIEEKERHVFKRMIFFRARGGVRELGKKGGK